MLFVTASSSSNSGSATIYLVPLVIRAVTPADSLPDVAMLVSRAFCASPVFAGIDEARYAPKQVIAALSTGTVLRADADGELVGAITVLPPQPASICAVFHDCPSFRLLAVAPGHGGRGIGTALVAAAEAAARRDGYSAMALSVTTRAPDLHRLYARCGYTVAEEFHWPGVLDPSYIMRKDLAG
jgi:GNAT superfamily N-acetyltransferase